MTPRKDSLGRARRNGGTDKVGETVLFGPSGRWKTRRRQGHGDERLYNRAKATKGLARFDSSVTSTRRDESGHAEKQ